MKQKKLTFWIILLLSSTLISSLAINGLLYFSLKKGTESLFSYHEFSQIKHLESNANQFKDIRVTLENGDVEAAKDRLNILYSFELSALRLFEDSTRKQTAYAATAALKKIEEKYGLEEKQ